MPIGLSRRIFTVAAAASVTAPAMAQAPSFELFLDDMAAAASATGVSPATVDRAFTALSPDPRVIELDRRQLQGRTRFVDYRDRIVNRTRIEGGRERYARHRNLLDEIERGYGVQSRVIVALWGIESSFGRVTGDFSVIRSLATLGHEGRRRELFTAELLAALAILETTPLSVDSLLGSWAGAMGQAQFMPSTYRTHAVDRDGSGHADIWSNLEEVFASMANYLSSIGWRAGWRWGRPVVREGGFANLPTGREDKRPLAFWAGQGVRLANGEALPQADAAAGLIVTDDGNGPAFLVYDNFDVIMQWNRSTFFALSVGLLSDSFGQRQ